MQHHSFDIFETFTQQSSSNEELSETKEDCSHTHILTDKGIIVCNDCGLEMSAKDTNSDEWKYHGLNDMKNSTNINQCYIRKMKDKTIYQDVSNMNISEHIKDIANDIYTEVCKEKVHRGTRRKSIIFASVFHAHKINRQPQSCDRLIKMFNIKRKDALKGLKYVNENISKTSPVRTLYITPEHIIHEFLCQFEVSEQKQQEIIDLYRNIKDKSSTLNRSRPQSVASGVIWYWIKQNQKSINIKEFTRKVNLSELTVTKMAKEIARLYGTEFN